MARNMEFSDFYCLNCTNKLSLPRPKSLRREAGHLKKIHCYKCKEEFNHYEVREIDKYDFSLEELRQAIADGEFEGKLKEEK